MKQRLLYLVPLVAIFISLASSLAPLIPQASAANFSLGGAGNQLLISLTGTNDPSKYTLTGTHDVNGKSVPVDLQYQSSKKAFLSAQGELANTGDPTTTCASSPAVQKANDIKVAATLSGKAAGNASYDLCGKGKGIVLTETLAVTSKAQAPASFCVKTTCTFKYTADTKYTGKPTAVVPFGNSATGTLKGGPNNQSYPVEFDQNGNGTVVKNLDNLLPGNYKVSLDYALISPAGNETEHCGKSFSLRAGQDYAFSATCAGNGASSTPTASGSDNATANSDLSCGFSASPLSWIICPIVDTLVGIVGAIDSLITDQMTIQTGPIFGDSSGTCSKGDTCFAYRTAWENFRDIALGLMVIAGIIVVIAQALGLEILDAYTIRKVLPRILIVAVGITLSWPLMKFFVELTNDLGFGIRHIIYAPFNDLKDHIDLSFGGGIAGTFFGGVTTAGVVGAAVPAWILLGGIGVLFSYAATAALAVGIAILVLILRQIAIVLLMLIAPLAIVAYILPNTQKLYKLWWESFSKALLMFPLIAAFIASGRVFSAIAIHQGGPVNGLIGFIAYFAPYFMIPATFKFAGGALRQIGGFVNDRGRGGFDRLRKYRTETSAKRLERARGAGLYRKKTGLSGTLNKIGFYTLDADEQIPYALGAANGPLTKGRYNPLGFAGRKLFGRGAQEAAGIKANQAAEHTAKGVEAANIHYSTTWAALGMRDRLVDGLTNDGRDLMDDEYGIDAAGKSVKGTRRQAVAWRAPKNGDTEALLTLGSDLAKSGSEGSQAQTAGRELREKAGILSSFGRHMETQRATLQSVAAATAARDGKLELGEGADVYNKMIDDSEGDPAGMAIAGALMTQLESAATQNRQDWRRGKGIRIDEHGKAYSVFDEEHFETPEAYENATSMKGAAASSAKAETITNMAPTIISIATGNRPDLLKDPSEPSIMRDTVLQGAANPYSDPAQRREWLKIAHELKVSDEEIEARRQATVDRANRETGATGGGGTAPPPDPFRGGGLGGPGGMSPPAPPMPQR